MPDVAKSDNTALSAIQKEHGELKAKALLTMLVADLVDYFSVGKSMGAEQVAQTVNLILEEYYYFKPDDFVLCFKNAKKFKYGKMYDRIDGMIIFEWLEKHAVERQVYFASLEENRSEVYDAKKEIKACKPVKIGDVMGDDSNIRKLLNSKR